MWKPEELLPYRLGGLLYTPALNHTAAGKIKSKAYPRLTAAAFCLEDSIQDSALPQAEQTLVKTLTSLGEAAERPLLFVRVRTPRHLERVHRLLGSREEVLTGYILPKFDLSNGGAYAELLEKYNAGRSAPLYMMPILESRMVARPDSRASVLMRVKEVIDSVRALTLNVRVGGNDFCNLYGLRRSVGQTIYQIGVIRDILMDILRVFSSDYVVSGPVWEYFGTDSVAAWAEGLRAELALDRLNGFIGKTAIHPAQLPLIYEGMQVDREDYEDALEILGWKEGDFGVSKSAGGTRMNEVKCHNRWAERICKLAQVYGVRPETGKEKENENLYV
ncbi:MAG: HpcH/HpaI aldolase/citrate lyase family protein [Oscillibacter sp.]|nr:HpcH/HpaI aldolase/citrate lyase family protein [Oscillibacter sp.]